MDLVNVNVSVSGRWGLAMSMTRIGRGLFIVVRQHIHWVPESIETCAKTVSCAVKRKKRRDGTYQVWRGACALIDWVDEDWEVALVCWEQRRDQHNATLRLARWLLLLL